MSGRTITDMISEQIEDAWAIYLSRDHGPWADESELQRRSVARGRVLGLAQALATVRFAPERPTATQVREVANEFKPEEL